MTESQDVPGRQRLYSAIRPARSRALWPQAVCWLLAIICLLAGCRKKEKASDLVVVSPHPDAAQKEFAAGFARWHQARYGAPARIEWRDLGGGSAITKTVRSLYGQAGRTSGLDIYFGGGAPDHRYLANEGCLQPIQLPEQLLADIPQTLGGVQQYDANAGWYGACISSFGILYNAKLLDKINAERPEKDRLPVPRRWDDLADPRMRGQTVAAGPESSSARASYELMLQTAGPWPAGWKRLLAFWANCQSFTAGASALPSRVHTGQALVATSIDYYAFSEIASAGPDELKFALPEDGVIFTPDPISVLKGAPHPEMAKRFIEFVLSLDGQALWCLPAGTPGGPKDKTLFRQPINRKAYEKYAAQFPPQLVNILDVKGQVTLDEKLQAARVPHVLPLMMKAAAIDNGDKLRAAWKRIIDKGMPPELMEDFARLPENLATEDALYRTAAELAAGDAARTEQITQAWTDFFRAKYERLK